MGRPYSLDLRERVVAAVHGGMSREAAAEHYDVSRSSAIRWVRRGRETGSPAARPLCQSAARGSLHWPNSGNGLQARVTAKPDITLRALLAELGERGIAVSS
jgi:transposase